MKKKHLYLPMVEFNQFKSVKLYQLRSEFITKIHKKW